MAKCAECGFLALRNLETRELVEAEILYRAEGKAPQPDRVGAYEPGDPKPVRFGGGIDPRPICFAGAANLIKESGELPEAAEDERYRAVVEMDRTCAEFAQWKQGFTPKEHREMLDRQEWRNWQESQRRSERHWRWAEVILIALLSGAFTLLGVSIQKGLIP